MKESFEQSEIRKVKVERTHSTNTLLKELIANGQWREGEKYLYTDFQTAGRGQAGNSWESEEGNNMLCSVLLSHQPFNADVHPFYLNVLISVAVHQVIRSFVLEQSGLSSSSVSGLTIKWPNDIYWQDKKIAGILIENAIIGGELKYSIAGIGLNVNQTTWLSDAPNPVSMRQISGQEYDIDALMSRLYEQVEQLQQTPREEVWVYYHEHLYRREGEWLFAEREVSIAPSRILTDKPKNAFMASIETITPNGELVLRTHAGTRIFHFKEIQFVI